MTMQTMVHIVKIPFKQLSFGSQSIFLFVSAHNQFRQSHHFQTRYLTGFSACFPFYH